MDSQTSQTNSQLLPGNPVHQTSPASHAPDRQASVDSELEFVKLQFDLLFSVFDAESAMASKDFLKILRRSLHQERTRRDSAAEQSLKSTLSQNLGNVPQSLIGQKLDLMSQTARDFADKPITGLGSVLSMLFEFAEDLLGSKARVLQLLKLLSVLIIAMAHRQAQNDKKCSSLTTRVEHLERQLGFCGDIGGGEAEGVGSNRVALPVPSPDPGFEKPPSRHPHLHPNEGVARLETHCLHKRSDLHFFPSPLGRGGEARQSTVQSDYLYGYEPLSPHFFGTLNFADDKFKVINPNLFKKSHGTIDLQKISDGPTQNSYNPDAAKELTAIVQAPLSHPRCAWRNCQQPGPAQNVPPASAPTDEHYTRTKKAGKAVWTSCKGIFCWSGTTNLKLVADDFAKHICNSVRLFATVDEQVVAKLSARAFTKAKDRPNVLIFRVKLHPKYKDLVESGWGGGSPSEYFKFKIDLDKEHRIRLWNLFTRAHEQREVPKYGSSRNRYSVSQANYVYESEFLSSEYINAQIAKAVNGPGAV